MIQLKDIDLAGKRVLVREDFNVPIRDGKVTNSERIERALPTLRYLQQQNAAIMIMSHLGRPQEGQFEEKYSLEPVADVLSDALNQDVRFLEDWVNGVDVDPGEVVLLQNVRFLHGETDNDTTLARMMAALCDVFVLDAFATAHRAEASIVGVAKLAPVACAGPLLMEEVSAIDSAMANPAAPVVAVIGGSKVSTKIHLLEKLLDRVDTLIVGGGIANTLLAAEGIAIGTSLVEKDQLKVAKRLIKHAKSKKVLLPLPVDSRVAKEFSRDASATVRSLGEIQDDEMILDVGPETAKSYESLLHNAGTIIWNGPVGVFEYPNFSLGTQVLCEAVANSAAFSIAGGGDTLAAIAKYNVHDKISYVSTGGGAFLEYLQGERLPGIAILEKRAKKYAKANE